MGSRRLKKTKVVEPPPHRPKMVLAVEFLKAMEFKLWRGELLDAEEQAELQEVMLRLITALECDDCHDEAQHKFCQSHFDAVTSEAIDEAVKAASKAVGKKTPT